MASPYPLLLTQSPGDGALGWRIYTLYKNAPFEPWKVHKNSMLSRGVGCTTGTPIQFQACNHPEAAACQPPSPP